ncbi:MAG: RND family transporter, partial [Paraburkholderia graminis]
MSLQSPRGDATPVMRSRAEFEAKSGSRLECLIFNNRLWIVAVCVLLTVLLGFQATRSNVSASYERMMPQSSPFIRNYLANIDSLRSLGNSVRVVVENRNGTIYDPVYLKSLREINDRAYLLPG